MLRLVLWSGLVGVSVLETPVFRELLPNHVSWTNVAWVAVHLNMQSDANHYSFAGRCFQANVPVDMETDMILVLFWAQHMDEN